jgi:hypothetical protein
VPEPIAPVPFIEVAETFCALIENCGSIDQPTFFRECFESVSRLLAEAVNLPDVGDLSTGPCITSQEYTQIVDRLKRQVGEKDCYTMVFDPWETPAPDLIHGSVSDDLADIWRELKDGFRAISRNDTSNAICEWRFSFLHHWGPHHATHLLRPLFSLAFSGEL